LSVTSVIGLQWGDEAKGKMELEGFGIFIHLDDDAKYSFVYESREVLDEAVGDLTTLLQH